MANYVVNITTDDLGEKGLDRYLAIVNADRAAAAPPQAALTKAQLLPVILNRAISNYAREYRVAFADRTAKALEAATSAQWANEATLLASISGEVVGR